MDSKEEEGTQPSSLQSLAGRVVYEALYEANKGVDDLPSTPVGIVLNPQATKFKDLILDCN
jgi:hypothetical protein